MVVARSTHVAVAVAQDRGIRFDAGLARSAALRRVGLPSRIASALAASASPYSRLKFRRPGTIALLRSRFGAQQVFDHGAGMHACAPLGSAVWVTTRRAQGGIWACARAPSYERGVDHERTWLAMRSLRKNTSTLVALSAPTVTDQRMRYAVVVLIDIDVVIG